MSRNFGLAPHDMRDEAHGDRSHPDAGPPDDLDHDANRDLRRVIIVVLAAVAVVAGVLIAGKVAHGRDDGRYANSPLKSWFDQFASGKLDEISRAIGAIETSVRELQRRADEDRTIGDRLHADNQRTIETSTKENREAVAASTKAVQEIKEIVLPLSKVVETMRPTVEAFAISRSKLAAWASVGFVFISFLGRVVEATVKWAVAWTWSHLH